MGDYSARVTQPTERLGGMRRTDWPARMSVCDNGQHLLDLHTQQSCGDRYVYLLPEFRLYT